MGSEWNSLTLEDIVVHQKGFPFKSKDYLNDGSPVVRVSNFTADSISSSDLKYVSSDIAEETKSVELKPYDVVVATVGSWPKNPESIVGKVVRVPEGLGGSLLNQNAVRLRVKSNSYYDQIYLYYLLKNKNFSDYIVSTAQGSANQASITLKDIYRYETDYPSDLERESIGKVLFSLDNKITLNRQLNQTLEQMAQALFKSWFVDFDPVLDNALAAGNEIPSDLQDRAERRQLQLANANHKPLPENIHKLFPSEFELTDSLGWVPKGWEAAKFPEGAEFREGPGILAKDFHNQGVPLIRLAGLKNGVSLLDGCNFLDPEKVAKKWNHFRLREGDILLSSSASLGRVAEVDLSAVGAVAYTGIISFSPVENVTNRRFLRHFLQSAAFQDQVTMMGVGSVLNHFGPTHIKNMLMPIPSKNVQDAFSEIVTPYDQSIIKRLKESESLSNTRDTLLPKLISGELRIPDAQTQLEEALV